MEKHVFFKSFKNLSQEFKIIKQKNEKNTK